MRIVSIVSIVFILILFAIENALACSCSNPPTIQESFERSAAVFYGSIESVENVDKDIVAVFRVERSWKGADNDLVRVRTDTTSCGMIFREGESHYLFVDKKGDEYYTVPCRRHSGSQETFLENKPTIALKSEPLPPKPVSTTTTPKVVEIRDINSQGFFSRDLLLIVGSSIISAVFVLIVVGAGFYIFKSRKR